MKRSIFSTVIFLGMNSFVFGQANYPNETAPLTPTQAPPSTANPIATSPSDNYSSASSDALDARPLSKGGFFIEPMIIATQEDTTIKTSQLPIVTDDTSGTSTGYGVGLRLGGHVSEIVLLGVDARYSKTTMDDSFYQKADSNAYDVAPVIGVQTPYYGVRLLAGYVVAGESDPNAGVTGLDLKFKEASGWRVGAGLFIAAVALNLEYQDLTYNSTEIQSLGSRVINKATSVDAGNRGYTLSVSFPVEL